MQLLIKHYIDISATVTSYVVSTSGSLLYTFCKRQFFFNKFYLVFWHRLDVTSQVSETSLVPPYDGKLRLTMLQDKPGEIPAAS
jgi:hypothetical protein